MTISYAGMLENDPTKPAAQPVTTKTAAPATMSYAGATQPVATQPATPAPMAKEAVAKTVTAAPATPAATPAVTPAETPAETPAVTPRVDPRNAARTRDDNRFRNAQEAKPKDTYYRPEYGWIMSDADVKKEQGVKGQFDTAITGVTDQMATADKDYKGALATGIGGINTAFDSAIAGAPKPDFDMIPVRVYNGAQLEGTYMIPRTIAQQLNTDSFNGEEGHFFSSWQEDDNVLHVDVTPVGTNDVYGKELHESLADVVSQVATEQTNADTLYGESVANANKERNAAIKKYRTDSDSAYAGQRTTWQAQLDYLKGGYGTRVKGGKEQYEASRKKYNESVMNMDAGLLERPTNQVTGRR